MEETIESKRLTSVDYIRIISCFLIVFHHYFMGFGVVPYNSILVYIAQNGYLGVEIFFLSSGFCMSMRHRDEEIPFISYIYKRISPWYVSYVFSALLSIFLTILCKLLGMIGCGGGMCGHLINP